MVLGPQHRTHPVTLALFQEHSRKYGKSSIKRQKRERMWSKRKCQKVERGKMWREDDENEIISFSTL
jgi:hypothetical protein